MGIQDRDWYRDAQKARDAGNIGRYHNGRGDTVPVPLYQKKREPLHPVWCVFLFFAICGGVFALLKLLSRTSA